MQHTTPLPEKVLAPKRAKTGDRKEAAESVTDFIYMGFPSRTFDAYPMLGKSLCVVYFRFYEIFSCLRCHLCSPRPNFFA